MFDVIERLKAEWTDKYVVIDSSAPELARFSRSTGQVKTVNMNGRCLVEFDQYSNVGWYDIDPACLRVVPKPVPQPAESKPKPTKSVATAASAPAAPTRSAAVPAGTKPSTADILAAARGKAAAKPAGEAKPAPGDRPSTAEILARARAGKAAAAAEPAAKPEVEDAPAETAPPAKAATKPKAAGSLPTTTADKIAWCRANDAKA